MLSGFSVPLVGLTSNRLVLFFSSKFSNRVGTFRSSDAGPNFVSGDKLCSVIAHSYGNSEWLNMGGSWGATNEMRMKKLSILPTEGIRRYDCAYFDQGSNYINR